MANKIPRVPVRELKFICDNVKNYIYESMYYNEIKFERKMIKMNTLTIIIFIFFLALGYVLVTYRKNRASVEYDERQASIRNHGYKYAFIAIAISDSFLLLLVEELKLKMTPTFLLDV